MFALKLAPKSRRTPPGVILSVALRLFPLSEIVCSRFPVGTRSRRISLRIHTIRNASRARMLLLWLTPLESALTKIAELTCAKSALTKSRDLKPFRINTCEKIRGGGAIPVRRNFVGGLPCGPKDLQSGSPVFRVPHPLGLVQKVGSDPDRDSGSTKRIQFRSGATKFRVANYRTVGYRQLSQNVHLRKKGGGGPMGRAKVYQTG
jgi:hypothetical protein